MSWMLPRTTGCVAVVRPARRSPHRADGAVGPEHPQLEVERVAGRRPSGASACRAAPDVVGVARSPATPRGPPSARPAGRHPEQAEELLDPPSRPRSSTSSSQLPTWARRCAWSSSAWLRSSSCTDPAGPVELEVGADPGEQLAGGERLDQVVVGAGLEPLDGALLAGARRQHDDGDRHRGRVGAQRGKQPEAVEVGHHHVGEDQVRRSVRASSSAIGAVGGGLDAVVGGRAAGPCTRACRRCRRRPGPAAGAVVDRPAGPSTCVGLSSQRTASRRRGTPPVGRDVGAGAVRRRRPARRKVRRIRAG